MNIKSIRETFVPPIVALIIAIGLVSDWSSAETPDSAVAPDASTITVRSMQTDSHIKTMSYSRAESGDARLIRLVYRLPLLTGQYDQYAQTSCRRQAIVAADCPVVVNNQCRQVMNARRPAKTRWM